MKEMNSKRTVLVTGATGYIASWIIKYLLEDGINVNATVRDINNKEKFKYLENIANNTEGTLKFFQANLLEKDSFSEAMKDCEIVFHTASPFMISKIKNPEKELIEPALIGTRNVLNEAKKNDSIKRVIVTASVVSLYGDAIDIKNTPNEIFTDSDWNVTSSKIHQPYSYSKLLAEKEAWKITGSQSKFDLITIHPGFVLGPSLTKRIDSESINFMLSLLNGKLKSGVPELTLGIVDIRDLAKIHISAAFSSEAKGRYIAVADSMKVIEIATILLKNYTNKYKIPQNELPKLLLYLLGPIQGLTWKYISKNVGFPLRFDNRKSLEELNITYRSIEETIIDHSQQLIDDKLI